jgi:hypothetical protein
VGQVRELGDDEEIIAAERIGVHDMYAIFVCSDMNLFRRAEESKKSG